MSKMMYKIPTSIDKSYFDMEINLQTKDGLGGKPISLGLIASYLVSVMLLFLILNKTFMASASLVIKVIFTITWIVLTGLLLKRDGTNVPQYSLVAAMGNYLPKAKRYVTTRSTSNATAFYGIVGIDSIDEDRGLIAFSDGTFGYMYQVVGSASILLFEQDRDAILDRVDKFWRKVHTDSEWIFLTVKEPQKIYKQVANLKDRYDNLDVDDPDLKGLLDAQFHMMRDVIGKEYRTIHQYLLIKADNKEALLTAKNILQGEVEGSSHMFKQCAALFGDELLMAIGSIYKGKESI